MNQNWVLKPQFGDSVAILNGYTECFSSEKAKMGKLNQKHFGTVITEEPFWKRLKCSEVLLILSEAFTSKLVCLALADGCRQLFCIRTRLPVFSVVNSCSSAYNFMKCFFISSLLSVREIFLVSSSSDHQLRQNQCFCLSNWQKGFCIVDSLISDLSFESQDQVVACLVVLKNYIIFQGPAQVPIEFFFGYLFLL